MVTTEKDTREKASRSERLEARISKAQKTLFVRAATVQGRSLTDFLIASVQEAAESSTAAQAAQILVQINQALALSYASPLFY